MTAEYSAPLVSRLSLTNYNSPQGYYRSKLFTAPATINPLISAASPLISLLERLCICSSLPPIEDTLESINHELQAFYCRINRKADYAEEFSAIAHYLLCATIDELLGKNYLRLYNKIAVFPAFTPSLPEQIGPERRFFDIVRYIKTRPHQYLDLIELAYYCLITGFEGEQHGRTDGRQVLDNLLEELYQLIKQHRVNRHYPLFQQQKNLTPTPKDSKSFFYITLLIIIGFIVAGAYCISYTLLGNQAEFIQFQHIAKAKLE